LTEKYLAALKNVLGETQVVMMPSTGNNDNNPMSPQSIAAAMTMYKKLVANGGEGSASGRIVEELLQNEQNQAQT
jgi:hypothetical protein